MKHVYLDYAATTPLDQVVFEKMTPYFSGEFGNPSSIHAWGQNAENALENARETVAGLIHCKPKEIIFTSGGSESDNLALRGTALARRKLTGANTILISPVEHPAVVETARQLHEWFGFALRFLSVDEFGRVHPDDLVKEIGEDIASVSIIYGNNEIGTVNDIAALAKICRDAGIPFHTDAVQAGAHLPIDLDNAQVDLLSLGAHKFYGPKGVGVLFAREGTPIIPTQTGGKQEEGFRAGTHNIPYIVGLAEALKISCSKRAGVSERIVRLRDRLIETVTSEIPEAKLTGHPLQRLPNHASFVFRGIDGNELLMVLDQKGFACSSGSACKVGNPKPSDVLLNLGIAPEWASGSLRVTLGRQTTEEEIDSFLAVLLPAIHSLRHQDGS